MAEYLKYLQSRTSLYPGEGERIVVLVQEVLDYVNNTESHEEVHNVTRMMYKIVDCLLKHKESLIDGPVSLLIFLKKYSIFFLKGRYIYFKNFTISCT